MWYKVCDSLLNICTLGKNVVDSLTAYRKLWEVTSEKSVGICNCIYNFFFYFLYYPVAKSTIIILDIVEAQQALKFQPGKRV